jgi:uncharacterized protein
MTVPSSTTANCKKNQRSKRLRKKMYLDEFATLGFELECEFKTDLDEDVLSEFIDQFFIDALAAKDLLFAGGLSSKRLSGFITAQQRYVSATDIQKQTLESWLKAQTAVAKVQVSQLMDANDYC